MQSNTLLSISDACFSLGFQLETIRSVLNSLDKLYWTFERKKRSGGTRTIAASQFELKEIQKRILDRIISRFDFPLNVHGGVKGRSTVTNASSHVGKEVVLNLDLEDFFGSVTPDKVQNIYQNVFNYDESTATILTNLSCWKNSLPQGAPTSGALANLAALSMDANIHKVLEQSITPTNFAYSRYIDDITISGTSTIIESLPEIYEAIELAGFRSNLKKTKILRQHTRQWVTGVVVNQAANPPKTIIRKVRQHLYYSQRYGFAENAENHDIKPDVLMRKLTGMIGFIRMTKPALADEFTSTLNRLRSELEVTEDEEVLLLLKRCIDEELIVEFTYGDVERKAAPSEIFLTDDPARPIVLIVRAFQLSPASGWEQFTLSDMEDVRVAKSQLS